MKTESNGMFGSPSHQLLYSSLRTNMAIFSQRFSSSAKAIFPRSQTLGLVCTRPPTFSHQIWRCKFSRGNIENWTKSNKKKIKRRRRKVYTSHYIESCYSYMCECRSSWYSECYVPFLNSKKICICYIQCTRFDECFFLRYKNPNWNWWRQKLPLLMNDIWVEWCEETVCFSVSVALLLEITRPKIRNFIILI